MRVGRITSAVRFGLWPWSCAVLLAGACADSAHPAARLELADAAVSALDAVVDGMAGADGASVSERDAGLSFPDAGDAGSAHDAGPAPRKARPIERGAISGTISGGNGPGITPPASELSSDGYVEEELTLSGEAQAYAAKGEQGLDGVWQSTVESKARYTTRILVRRPALAEHFNGTVLVEWLNVTGQIDTAVGYVFAREELLRAGYVYVAVSVQKAGVDALKLTDGTRYEKLDHPGDAYAYDIFAQAGAAIGWPGTLDALHGLRVQRLIAYGESQSAMRMITYVNAVQPQTHVYDGVIIHSRAGWGAPVGSEGNGLLGNGKPVHVRADSDARVLQLFTESELFLALGPAYAARQPDSDRLRTWEMAGTAHADARLLGEGTDIGCGKANEGHQHLLVKAGLRAMHDWLKDDRAPPSAQPLAVDAAGQAIVRDSRGNALGGVRTPAVDVPIAKLSGEPDAANSWNPSCMLFGSTLAFTPEQLSALYPTHQDYVDKVLGALQQSERAGFVLNEDVASVLAQAMAAHVPN